MGFRNIFAPVRKATPPTPQQRQQQSQAQYRPTGGGGGANSFTSSGSYMPVNAGASWAAGANNRVVGTNEYGGPAYSGIDQDRWTAAEQRWAGQATQPPGNVGGMMGGNMAGGGAAGGGGGGPDLDAIRAQAEGLFAFNADPYNQMRAGIEESYRFNPQPYDTMVGQAQGYNPDFAGMEAGAAGRMGEIEAQRATEVARRQQMLQQALGNIGSGYSVNMQNALRDLAGQGVNTQGYIDQAGQRGGELAQQSGEFAQLGSALDRNAVNANADSMRGLSTIRMGGEAELANNRSTLLNQIARQRADQELQLNQQRSTALGGVGIQQAKDQQALEQAKREFLLRYGIG